MIIISVFTIIALLLIAMSVMIVTGFIAKKSTGKYIFGYYVSYIIAVILLLTNISRMSDKLVRIINSNMIYFSIFGILLIICSFIAKFVIKKKNIFNKRAMSNSLTIFGVLVIILSNFITMYTYIELTKRNEPVVTVFENVIVYTDTEYHIEDFISIENSHGETFGKVVWADGNYEDTTGIVLDENKESFTVSEDNGELYIMIYVYGVDSSEIDDYVIVSDVQSLQ